MQRPHALADTNASSGRPVILLTGFGPFPSVPVNATTLLVPELAEKVARRYRSHRVAPAILPTEWAAGPETAVSLLASHAPVVALHFGVSSRARGFEIELLGRNFRSASSDASGQVPSDDCVIEGAPQHLATNLPAARIVARLRRRRIPAYLSRDAGSYLCNALLYHSLATARHLRQPVCNGFIHVPDALVPHVRRRPGAVRCPLDWSQAIDGAMEIVATCIGAAAD